MNRVIAYVGQPRLWQVLGFVVFLVILFVRRDWPSAVVASAMATILFVYDARRVDDDAPCGKCGHRKDDHHGNCQACLRDEVSGRLARDVPCARFARTRSKTPLIDAPAARD